MPPNSASWQSQEAGAEAQALSKAEFTIDKATVRVIWGSSSKIQIQPEWRQDPVRPGPPFPSDRTTTTPQIVLIGPAASEDHRPWQVLFRMQADPPPLLPGLGGSAVSAKGRALP